MKAALLRAPRDLEIADLQMPDVVGDRVLIRVTAAGICATDVEVFAGDHPASLPIIMGHEFAGEVVQVGPEAAGVRTGDRVVSEASWGCGACASCRAGRPDKCQNRQALGRSVNGAFAEFVSVPARVVHTLPTGVSAVEGQVTVNLACGCRAVHQAGIKFGETVYVIGSGPVALLLIQVLKHSGAGRIGLVGGSRQSRLDLAKTLGADEIVCAPSEQGRSRLTELSSAETVDVVIEASGAPSQLEGALQLMRPGGKVVIFSIYSRPVERFSANFFYFKEPTMLGSRGGAGFYGIALDLLRRKQVLVEPLISHEYPLEQLGQGLDAMVRRDPDVIRILVKP